MNRSPVLPGFLPIPDCTMVLTLASNTPDTDDEPSVPERVLIQRMLEIFDQYPGDEVAMIRYKDKGEPWRVKQVQTGISCDAAEPLRSLGVVVTFQ